jgi:hypothetical protein
MKTIHFFTIIAAVLLLSDCRKTGQKLSDLKRDVATIGDASFARNTFESLARGDSSAAENIDWPVFTSLGNNIGMTYVALSSEVEKEKFITGFITQFATSFRESGGRIEDFSNWRVMLHNDLRTEIAADSPNGDLTVIVANRDGKERVTSINILK